MAAENKESKTHFGNLTTFYSLLYTSAAVFFIGLALIFTDAPDFGIIFILIASILMIITFVLFYVILYRLWKFIISKEMELGIIPSIQSAGQAVGFLFIPLFNFYWLFKGLGKLPFEINLVAKKYNVDRTVQDNLGYIIATLSLIGLIPFVGYATGAINVLILLPIFISRCVEVCELILSSDAIPDKATEIVKAERTDWRSIQEFTSLFDKEKYGLNYFIGVALFVSLLLVRLIRLAFLDDFDLDLMPSFDYLLIGVAFDIILSFLFILVCNIVTKNWLHPFVWGAIVAAVFYFKSIIIMNSQFFPGENIIKIPYPNIFEYFNDFIWGFTFMFGFVFAVNMWGAKIWSLITGFALSFFVYKVLYILLSHGPVISEINYDYFFSGMDGINLFGRIFTALFIFGALFIHFDNLQSKNMLQRSVPD